MKLISWNIWGMPFVNPNSYSAPIKSIQQTINNFDKTYELQVFSIQECWVWRAGAFHWITTNLIEILPNEVLCILHLLSLLVTSFILTYKYNPLEYVDIKENLYVYQDTNIKFGNIMNSGLVIVSNQEADESGFEYFTSSSGLEKIASKGFQFIYYEDINTIIINTHLQSGKNTTVKENQLEQIRAFIKTYNQCNIFINGDFNIDIEDMADDKIARTLELNKINGIEDTTNENKSYDHCYTNVNLEFEDMDYEICQDDISDHYKLIINIDKDLR